jgi:hypothetical protein
LIFSLTSILYRLTLKLADLLNIFIYLVTAGKSSCANRWKYSILNHILKIQGAELGEEESLAEAVTIGVIPTETGLQ